MTATASFSKKSTQAREMQWSNPSSAMFPTIASRYGRARAIVREGTVEIKKEQVSVRT